MTESARGQRLWHIDADRVVGGVHLIIGAVEIRASSKPRPSLLNRVMDKWCETSVGEKERALLAGRPQTIAPDTGEVMPSDTVHR